MRRVTRQVQAGKTKIGGGSTVTVQSMLNRPASDRAGNVEQAKALAAAGCEILRVAVPTREDVELIEAIKSAVDVALVADVHFDYRIALDCVAAGVDKLRINPGNIGGADKVRQLASACGNQGIPIRVGVNGGSLERELLAKYGGPTAEALVESALNHAKLLERWDFGDVVLSMKSSHVPRNLEAYRLAARQCDYPLHLGVTEAGTAKLGMIKSAIGIGALLAEGIGDTIRVSLTDDPLAEIEGAYGILQAVGLRRRGPEIIACPTCGRTSVKLMELVAQVEEALSACRLPVTVAVMGCVVNGPGEAREADFGIAGGKGAGLLFRKGVVLGKYPEEELVPALLAEIAAAACEV